MDAVTATDPQTVREETVVVDFATPLAITNITTVYYAYDEQDESWEGAGFFIHFDDALWMTARSWANEEYGYDTTPPEKTTWRKGRHLWRLYDGDSPTDIVVSDSPLHGSVARHEVEYGIRDQPDGDVQPHYGFNRAELGAIAARTPDGKVMECSVYRSGWTEATS